MEFNDTDLAIISNALRVAGERFGEHSEMLKREGYASMAAVFDEQRKKATLIYGMISHGAGIQT